MKNKLKWARIMKLIRDVEEKYGRISKVPTTDKEWQEIQELCCSEDDKNINLSSKVQKKIAKRLMKEDRLAMLLISSKYLHTKLHKLFKFLIFSRNRCFIIQ